MRTFAVGIVGAGNVVNTMHLPVLVNMPRVRVAWITDEDAGRAEATAEAFGIRSVPLPEDPVRLPPCDVLLLAIPLHAREPYYRAAAAAGIPTLAEKPFAITAAEHRRVLEMYGATPVACGYMRRWYASSRVLRRVVQEGWFGNPVRIRLSQGARVAATGFDATFQDLPFHRGGGVLLAIGCHSLDLAFFILGAGTYQLVRKRTAFDGSTDRAAEAELLLPCPAGPACRVHFAVSWLEPLDHAVEIEFERVRLSCGVTPESRVRLAPLGAAGGGVELSPPPGAAITPYQSFYQEWDEFLSSIESGKPSLLSASTCLPTTQVIEELAAGEGHP